MDTLRTRQTATTCYCSSAAPDTLHGECSLTRAARHATSVLQKVEGKVTHEIVAVLSAWLAGETYLGRWCITVHSELTGAADWQTLEATSKVKRRT